MIGIGMPMAQARMPFMAVLLWLCAGATQEGWRWFQRATWPCGVGRLHAGQGQRRDSRRAPRPALLPEGPDWCRNGALTPAPVCLIIPDKPPR